MGDLGQFFPQKSTEGEEYSLAYGEKGQFPICFLKLGCSVEINSGFMDLERLLCIERSEHYLGKTRAHL